VIFIDANILLRHFTEAETPADLPRKAVARELCRRMEAGEVSVTTSEIVLHEVCYILTSRRHYGQSSSEVILAIRTVLQWPGFVLPANERALFVRALDLWEQHPKLEFSDAVIAARCERGDHELATFDRHFDAIESVRKWSPESDLEPVSQT